jgi:hypothetical protein
MTSQLGACSGQCCKGEGPNTSGGAVRTACLATLAFNTDQETTTERGRESKQGCWVNQAGRYSIELHGAY